MKALNDCKAMAQLKILKFQIEDFYNKVQYDNVIYNASIGKT